jgi:hypothetical protein
VLVDGRVVKREGRPAGVDLPALTAAAILRRVADAIQALPGTPPRAWAGLEPMALGFRDQARAERVS